MPHGVKDGQVEHVPVQRVVEAVTPDLVRRLEQAGDRGRPDTERNGRQQAPLHLGGQGHALASADEMDLIGVPRRGEHEMGRGHPQLEAQVSCLVVPVRQGQLEDTEPISALGHRHPDGPAMRPLDGERLLRPEAAPHHRALSGHRLGLAEVRQPVGARPERLLLVVEQEEHHVAALDLGHRHGDRLDDVLRRDGLGRTEEATDGSIKRLCRLHG